MPHLGTITNGKMELSLIGSLAERFWLEIPNHFPNVILDAFVIMPDDMHGILILGKQLKCTEYTEDYKKSRRGGTGELSGMNKVLSDRSPKGGSVSVIIRSYKSVVSKNARLMDPGFQGHKLFYDVIIRDQHHFENVRNYIVRNPENWRR